jgi:hypothetical protein
MAARIIPRPSIFGKMPTACDMNDVKCKKTLIFIKYSGMVQASNEA